MNVDRRPSRLRPFLLSVVACVVLAACGKTTAPSDGGPTPAPSVPPASTEVRESPLPFCEPWIVTELAVPKDWRTYPIVSTSGRAVTIETRSFDHYVDELTDVPIGPFMLRYWQGQTRPTTEGLAVRLAGCQNTPLQVTALSYWNGGPVILRMKESVFIISSGGSFEELITVFRRLPR